MSALEFVAAIVAGLAWPGAVITIALIVRGPNKKEKNS